VIDVRLQRIGQGERGPQIQWNDDSSGIGGAASVSIARRKDERRVGKQIVPVRLDKLEGHLLQRDNNVEALVPVFATEEITQRFPVLRIGKPYDVQVLSVVIDVACESCAEDPRQLEVSYDRELRVLSGRIQDEHCLLAVRSPRGTGGTE
jgi:hypothetical protein